MMKLIVVAVAVLALAAPTAAIDEECKACKAIGVSSNQPTTPPRPAPPRPKRAICVPFRTATPLAIIPVFRKCLSHVGVLNL